MEILKKIKQVLGIGTVKVKLEVDRELSRQGSVIQGRILLSAKSDQSVIDLSVKLEENWKIGKGEDEQSKTFDLGEWRDSAQFDMKAGEEKIVPFTLNYALVKSKNDRMQETAGKVGKTLGGLGKLMDGEKSVFWLTATADVKGAAFDPNDAVEMKLVD